MLEVNEEKNVWYCERCNVKNYVILEGWWRNMEKWKVWINKSEIWYIWRICV